MCGLECAYILKINRLTQLLGLRRESQSHMVVKFIRIVLIMGHWNEITWGLWQLVTGIRPSAPFTYQGLVEFLVLMGDAHRQLRRWSTRTANYHQPTYLRSTSGTRWAPKPPKYPRGMGISRVTSNERLCPLKAWDRTMWTDCRTLGQMGGRRADVVPPMSSRDLVAHMGDGGHPTRRRVRFN